MKKMLITTLSSIMVLSSCNKVVDPQETPDLTLFLNISSFQIPAAGTIQEVIQLKNEGSGPTTGTIVFTVTNYQPVTGLTVTSNSSPAVTIGASNFTITNSSDWDVTSSTSLLTFTSKPGVVIGTGGSKLVGVTISRAASPNQGSDGPVTQSIIIATGTGGGEIPDTNNRITSTIVK